MTDLNELKKLAEAATPGPWSCPIEDHDSIAAQVEFIERPGGLALSAVWLASVDQENRGDYDSERCFSQEAENDRRFIAAANPTTVLDLIARLERAEKALEQAAVFLDINDLSVITSVFARDIGGIKRCQAPELAAWLKERR